MMSDPQLLELHRELAIHALEGTAFQLASAARLLSFGDDRSAVTAYRRAVATIREFASPEMRVIADALDQGEGGSLTSQAVQVAPPSEVVA